MRETIKTWCARVAWAVVGGVLLGMMVFGGVK